MSTPKEMAASVSFVIVSCTLNEENQLRTLSKNKINQILLQGKGLSESEVTSILDEFETEQPEIYQAIFGVLSDGIVEVNQDMANLFLRSLFRYYLDLPKSLWQNANN